MAWGLIPIIGLFSLAAMIFALCAGALGAIWGAPDVFMEIVGTVVVVAVVALITCLFLGVNEALSEYS